MSEKKIYCSECGAQMPENSRFCPECGAPVPIQVWNSAKNRKDEEPQYVSVNDRGKNIFPKKAVMCVSCVVALLIVCGIFFGVKFHNEKTVDETSLSTNDSRVDISGNSSIRTYSQSNQSETDEDETTDEIVEASDEIISSTIDEGKFQLGETVFTLYKSTCGELYNEGCIICNYDTLEELSPDYIVTDSSGSAYVEYGNYEFKIYYENLTEDTCSLKDCIIDSFKMFSIADGWGGYNYTDIPFYISGGLTVGDSLNDVVETLGDPNDTGTVDGSDNMLMYYDYYGINSDCMIQHCVRIGINKNTSCIDYITCLPKSSVYNIALGNQCFPYKQMNSGINTFYLYGEFSLDDFLAEINPIYLKYYEGEITELEYANSIYPLLDEYGFHENYANHLKNEYSSEDMYEFEKELLRETLGDELYEAYYRFLE